MNHFGGTRFRQTTNIGAASAPLDSCLILQVIAVR